MLRRLQQQLVAYFFPWNLVFLFEFSEFFQRREIRIYLREHVQGSAWSFIDSEFLGQRKSNKYSLRALSRIGAILFTFNYLVFHRFQPCRSFSDFSWFKKCLIKWIPKSSLNENYEVFWADLTRRNELLDFLLSKRNIYKEKNCSSEFFSVCRYWTTFTGEKNST